MQPYGGTEIQFDYLRKYGNKNLLDLVQITTSVPEKEPLILYALIFYGLKIHTINRILPLGLIKKKTIRSTTGMSIIPTGLMKNLDIFLTFLILGLSL